MSLLLAATLVAWFDLGLGFLGVVPIALIFLATGLALETRLKRRWWARLQGRRI